MRKIDSYASNLLERAKRFSVLVIQLSSQLPKNPAGYAIASQLVRSATSIGANLVEAQESVSRKEFIYKVSIAVKESKECLYWLELIIESKLVDGVIVRPILQESAEIVKILVVSLRKLRDN